MKKYGVVVCLVLSFLLLSGCTTQTVVKRAYQNATYGFSLDPPTGWQRFENESTTVAVRFTPGDQNVSLIVAPPVSLGEGRALSTVADQLVDVFSQSTVDFTVVERNWTTVGGLTAYTLIGSYRENGSLSMIEQVAVLQTRTVYVVLFSAPEQQFTQYRSVVNQSIASFIV
jgi:hypothetical protein